MYLSENYSVLDGKENVVIHGDPIVITKRHFNAGYIKTLIIRAGVSEGTPNIFCRELVQRFKEGAPASINKYAIAADLGTCFVQENGDTVDLFVDTAKSRNAYESLLDVLDEYLRTAYLEGQEEG